jgi:hypothetical protein
MEGDFISFLERYKLKLMNGLLLAFSTSCFQTMHN